MNFRLSAFLQSANFVSFFEAFIKSLNLPMFTLIGSLILIFKELVLRFVKSADFEFYRREFDLSNQFFN